MAKHIMLVDDDEDDRDFFLSVLESIEGAPKCETAPNGLSALQQLHKEGDLPGIIFLDLNMPVMNGKQFLAEAKKHKPLKDIPVIILSTSSDQTTMADTANLGAAGFITKPNKLSLLEARLREILTDPAFNREL